jgi:CRP/FNR family transcriptional activator FtrB
MFVKTSREAGVRTEDEPTLRDLPLFRTMAEASFDSLIRAAYLQTFPPQVHLISEGDTADFLHVLVEGSVELFGSWNRRETTMAILEPVTSFILAATITGRPYLMSARTIEKSRIALVPSEDVLHCFAEDTAFAKAIVHDLAGAFRVTVRQSKDLKLRSSIERLANYLVRLHVQTGGTGAFRLPCEKRLIASLLGMTPENLSRAFAGLRAYGVQVEGNDVTLAKPGDLMRLAKPDTLIDGPIVGDLGARVR